MRQFRAAHTSGECATFALREASWGKKVGGWRAWDIKIVLLSRHLAPPEGVRRPCWVSRPVWLLVVWPFGLDFLRTGALLGSVSYLNLGWGHGQAASFSRGLGPLAGLEVRTTQSGACGSSGGHRAGRAGVPAETVLSQEGVSGQPFVFFLFPFCVCGQRG